MQKDENLDDIEWKHVYTIKEMTPIQGNDTPNIKTTKPVGFNHRPVGGRGKDFVDPRKINPNRWSLRFNPPEEWRGIKYNNHWFGMVHLLEKNHKHFNIQDFYQKGGGPINHPFQKKHPRYRKALEIGSYMGEAARMMMSSGIFDELTIIDPWAGPEEASEKFSETWDNVLYRCGENLIEWRDHKNDSGINKINVLRGYSTDVYQQFMDNDFDFIYIDASHKYEDVKADIQLYSRKLRHHGIMAGNDYDVNMGGHEGVKKAVDEFFGEDKVTRFIDSSWWTVKPKLKYLK